MKQLTVKQLFDLTGKVALVTGCRNLGYDAAMALAEAGAAVVLTRRCKTDAFESARRLTDECGTVAAGKALLVNDENNWKQVVDEIMGEFGRIDILVNNAGGRRPVERTKGNYDDLSEEFLEGRSLSEWEYGIDVNLTGVFLGCKTVVPNMRKTGYGKIINIASIDGMLGRDLRVYEGSGLSPTVPDYLAAKAGVINLTRGLAVALAPHGIYVNCISPGGFERGQPQEFISNYEKRVPIGRMGKDGEDIKGAVLYLASPASDYVVGHNLVLDGGWSAW